MSPDKLKALTIIALTAYLKILEDLDSVAATSGLGQSERCGFHKMHENILELIYVHQTTE